MSELEKMLEVNKYLASRLWYTSLTIHRTKFDSHNRIENDVTNFHEFEALIKNAFHSEDAAYCPRIVRILLQELSWDKSWNPDVNLETFHDYVDIYEALKLCDTVPTSMYEELLVFLQTDENCADKTFDQLSKQTLTFLRRKIHEDPGLTCWIINELLYISCNSFCSIICALEDLYVSTLGETLNCVPQKDNRCFDGKIELCSAAKDASWKDYFRRVLCLLSKMKLTEQTAIEVLTWLYPKLERVYDIRQVELALYCRSDEKLFKEWCCFMNEKYARTKNIDNLETALRVSNVLFSLKGEHTTLLCANELLHRIIKRNIHWLVDILDICHILTLNEKYQEVSSILSWQLLRNIWAILLFKILEDCTQVNIASDEPSKDYKFVYDSIVLLMEKCNFPSWNDVSIHKLNLILKNRLAIVEHVLDYRKMALEKSALLDENGKYKNKGELHSVKQIIFHLEHCTVLSSIKATTNIHEQNYEKVQLLLNKIGQPDTAFTAYSSMLSALKAILFCESYETNYEYVTEQLCNMEQYLDMLVPLTLRLEMIQNIFSFLFLRYEDFYSIQNTASTSVIDEKSGSESKSTGQSMNGFICNKYAVREVLHYLKTSTLAAGVAYTVWKRQIGYSQEVENTHKILSAVTKALADAMWRLKLYTNSHFINNVGHPKDENHTSDVADNLPILPDERLDTSGRLKDIASVYHEETMLDEIKAKTDSSSESGLDSNVKWQRRTRNFLPMINASPMKNDNHRQFFINYMLAPVESLVFQCLWRGNYEKAQHVIQMFDIMNTMLDSEVQFSKSLHAFKQSICNSTYSVNNQSSTTTDAKSSMLGNIRLAAREGVQSFKHASQLETFIASQEIHLKALSSDLLNSTEMLTLSVLDLALTVGEAHQTSSNLCDVASKYLKSCKTFDKTEHAHFFYQAYQLLYKAGGRLPLSNILCDAKHPLSVKAWEEANNFWHNITLNHNEFKEQQQHRERHEIFNENIYVSDFNAIKKILATTNNNEKYLQNTCHHLQLLCTIIPTPADTATSFTITDLLKIPLHYYFGHQIFDLKIEPNTLETIAQNLKVNLIHNILITACPKLPSGSNEMHSNIQGVNTQCIVLNQSCYKSNLWACKNQSPNHCILEILNELLETLQSLNLGQSTISYTNLKTISDSVDIQTVLSKTSALSTLDLSELSVGDETLTFFLNTWNVMFLHASLMVWAGCPPFNTLHHEISLMSIGYIIGDLGLVTLAALRMKLIDNLGLHNKFFPQVEELNEVAWQDLDLTQDPRVVFAMSNEFYGTPQVCVYKAETLNKDLDKAMHDYLEYYSSIDCTMVEENLKKIVLPDLVRCYENYCMSNCKTETGSEDKFSIHEYFRISEDNLVIEYTVPSYSYNVILKYSMQSCIRQKTQISTYALNWQVQTVRSSLLQYLENHCWILSYLLQRIHNKHPTILENICDNLKRTACLENLLNSSWVQELKSLLEDNQTLAAIYEMIQVDKLWSYFQTILEGNRWLDCLKIVNALPDNILTTKVELQYFRDKILSHLVSNNQTISDAMLLQYLYQINDVYILTQTVLNNVKKWHVHICECALFHTLYHVDHQRLPMDCELRMKETLHRVRIFHKMLPYCINKSNTTWYDIAYCTERIDPFHIIDVLINAEKADLCLMWLECQSFSLEIQSSVRQEFLIGLLKDESQNFQQARKLLQALPLNQSLNLCKGVLKNLESINALRFVVDYLLKHCKATQSCKYKHTLVGLDILEMLERKDRPLYIQLIKKPLLMLEQLLMNCKFESIQKILNALREKLVQNDISLSNFDATVRYYAERALDCRVSLQREGIENRSRITQGSISELENIKFVMPVVVPTREEWMPDDKARVCSCCRSVIFSMFNRRHHCRRCGRVICSACSQHHMQVSGYPASVLVRVCDDCKYQTVLQMRAVQGAVSTPSSEMFDYWQLTRDQNHNQSIREEFSFEYAPNISLCLAILNLHSDHKGYTSFLLDHCHEMKRFLQPVSGGEVNPEVDHTVIIKMIRSLLIAAKVKCAKLGLNTGLAHCDRFLSQVDLISTLVQSGSLDLIPSGDLNEHALRKLRDLLTEKEQWTLALDVSTKAGLDTQGVWAAWGKARLKMGDFTQAREKFFHCLDKISHEDVDDWVVLSYPNEQNMKEQVDKLDATIMTALEHDRKTQETSTKRTEFGKSRPQKDPPLLTEIMQILDNLNTYKYDFQQLSSAKLNIPQDVLSSYGTLKLANDGLSTVRQSNTFQNVYYQEGLYYLTTYASYSSILGFFLKHKEYDKCLSFALENDIELEMFFNGVYLQCLKSGCIEKLHEAMKNKDATLLMWKKYLISVCHNLEKRQYLHILYQLQLFMKDSIRAAMTSIRFYMSEVNNYTDLCTKGHFLVDAQKHLESEMQVDALSKKRRKSVCSTHSGQGILTMEMEPLEIDKHINTICRQMEIAKFLGNCEKEGRMPTEFLCLFPDMDDSNVHSAELPTLFGNQQQKTYLAVLAILCGRDVGEGFGIAFRIMQDYNLPQQKVYSLTGHVLALKNEIGAIEQLIRCCHSSGTRNSHIISDHVLIHCIKLFLNRSPNEGDVTLKNHIDTLIRLITDVELKINAYVESKQLKAAYLLAVKYSRAQDIRQILKESDRLGQNAIKVICLKWLQQQGKL